MNESKFISTNQEQWKELESLLDSGVKDPDQLHELFVKVSSDLSYARTFYPKRAVRVYLNSLTQRVLDLIQTRRTKFSWSDLLGFYRHTLPQQLWRARHAFVVSFVVFAIAIIIGVMSTAHDLEFTRVILGDAYVEMTNKNINEGDPMAVYKSSSQVDMFWGITLNNIRVAFLAFVMGLFGSIGTIIILFYNGIMLGSFQYFFFKKGLFLTSFLTIWIHGTIEISAIIIAGAAGLILGDGILHPKTFSRSLSLKIASKRAVRVLVSTIPLFIIAGFLESYVTRLTDLPVFVKSGIILLSLLFIIYHFVIYPYRYQLKNDIDDSDYNLRPDDLDQLIKRPNRYRSFGEVSEITLAQFRSYLGSILYKGIMPAMLVVVGTYWTWAKYGELMQNEYVYAPVDTLLFNYDLGGWALLISYWIALIIITSVISMSYNDRLINWNNYFRYLKHQGGTIAILTLPYLLVFYFTGFWPFFLFAVVIPPQIFFGSLDYKIKDDLSFINALKKGVSNGYNRYVNYLGPFALLSFFYFLLLQVVATFSNVLYTDFLSWHNLFPGYLNNTVYIQSIFTIIVSSIGLILYYFMYTNQHRSIECRDGSQDLFDKIASFGSNNEGK